jgi:hypothetical protein
MTGVFKSCLITTCLFGLAFAAPAHADIWRWVDIHGAIHFVDSKTPIYTWTDEQGRVFYSDTPDHETAVSVELVWVSGGTLDEASSLDAEPMPITGGRIFAEENAEEIAARAQARKEFCERATEVYDSYVKAPRLYKTDDDGKKTYLSAKEAQRIITETKAKKDDACG